MADAYKPGEYLSALEVSKIEGISKVSVINRCQSGRYPGAIKAQADSSNRQGIWLIPKSAIDASVKAVEEVRYSHTMSRVEFEAMMDNLVRRVVREELMQQQTEIAGAIEKQTAQIQEQGEQIGSRLDRLQKKSFWQRLFG